MCSSSSSSKRVCVVGLMGEQSNTVRILLRNDRKSRHRLVAPRAGARARQPTSEHLLSLGHTPTHTPVSQQRVFVACARVVRVCVCVHVHMLAFRLYSPLSPSIWGGEQRRAFVGADRTHMAPLAGGNRLYLKPGFDVVHEARPTPLQSLKRKPIVFVLCACVCIHEYTHTHTTTTHDCSLACGSPLMSYGYWDCLPLFKPTFSWGKWMIGR